MKNFHFWILGYGYTPNPSISNNDLSPCWQDAMVGGSAPSSYFMPEDNLIDCQAQQFGNPTKGDKDAFNAFYDDTGYPHTTPTDAQSMTTDCYDQGWPNWTNSRFEGEYMAPTARHSSDISSLCATQAACWKKVTPSGFTVDHFFAELYTDGGSTDNLLSLWEKNPAFAAGVINLDSYAQASEFATPGEGTGIENAIEAVCSHTANGGWLGVYEGDGIAKFGGSPNAIDDTESNGYHTIEWYVLQAMNACTS